MKGQRLAYIRVSSEGQNEERQLDGMEFDKVFLDKASGANTQRPAFQEMMSYARASDTVYAHSIDRLCRDLGDLRNTVLALTTRGCVVEFVSERLVFSGDDNPMSALLMNLLGSIYEFERKMIKRRQLEGVEIAKRNGKYKGRKPKLTDQQAEELRQRVAAGEAKASVGRSMGISRETVYAYLGG